MWFAKTDYIVLRLDNNGFWDFMAFATKQAVNDFLGTNDKAVLVRFNVRIVGNNTACETYADAEKALVEEKMKNAKACITMMAPSRDLPSKAHTMYYDAEKLFG